MTVIQTMQRPGHAPAPLPYCAYPKSSDVRQHGVLVLPERLPLARLEESRQYRSRLYRPVPLAGLARYAVLEAAEVVAESFAMRESQCKLICDQCGYVRDCSDP